MPKRKKSTPERYRGGKTIEISPGQGSVSLQDSMELLGIGSKETFLKHRRSLGIESKRRLTWDDLRDLLGMKLWLISKLGTHSREQYLALKEHHLEQAALQRFGIDLNQTLEGLKEVYECKQRQWQRNQAS